jgi:hypothetical protein
VAWLVMLSTTSMLGTFFSVYYAFYHIGVEANVGWLAWFTELYMREPLLLGLVTLFLLHSPWIFLLTCSQVYFVLRNVTTNEVMNWHRYSYLAGSFRGVGSSNSFDLGLVRNLLEFFDLFGHGRDWSQDVRVQRRV